jgi:hypothetical protein
LPSASGASGSVAGTQAGVVSVVLDVPPWAVAAPPKPTLSEVVPAAEVPPVARLLVAELPPLAVRPPLPARVSELSAPPSPPEPALPDESPECDSQPAVFRERQPSAKSATGAAYRAERRGRVRVWLGRWRVESFAGGVHLRCCMHTHRAVDGGRFKKID